MVQFLRVESSRTAARDCDRRPLPETLSAAEGDNMFGRVGIPELLIILAIIILIFGASRLPEIGRGIGKGIRNFKDSL